ncbi:hypothetical protein DFQ27_004161 [Actinomortierella ambigua]|uniref:Uncharacterized protein n=1 Tax=Actinomortierella ambigua TaxID=1343610 RepID=A0A9P6U4I6_9FUNG|nr:hypothetical protein DFQ27_004161 [Actinomortierella ambigua]
MESELIQQLTVDDPREVRELTLDGFEIDTVELLLVPPPEHEDDEEEDDDIEMHSTLDQFINLIRLSLNRTALTSLEGFPHLSKLKWLSLEDNKLKSGFDALSKADLQSLVRLDLSRNMIADESVLDPLDALGNLEHITLADNELASRENYRDAVFNTLPQLISVDGQDRDGLKIDLDAFDFMESDNEGDEEYVSDGQEDNQEGVDYEIEANEGDIREDDEDGSQPFDGSDQRLLSADEEDEGEEFSDDDKENRPPTASGVAYNERYEEDEDDDDEEEDEEEERDDDELEEDDDDIEEDIEEEEEEEDEEEEEEEEGPGLAYLMQDNIADDQEDEEDFEPGEEPEEDEEMESSDEEDYPAGSGSSSSVSKKQNAKGQNGSGADAGGAGAAAAAAAGAGTAATAAATAADASLAAPTQNGSHASPLSSSSLPPKRPLSSLDDDHHHHHHHQDGGRGDEDDHGLAISSGFDDDGTNGFGMDNFEGPATFGDDTGHDSKRMRL